MRKRRLTPAALLRRLHADDRGAISILVLLTIWCLVALIGMIWNTGEQARTRQKLQTAADSAAQSAATWMARTVNAIDAQNMILCQDASAETIWRAIPPADQSIQGRLDQERKFLNDWLTGKPLTQLRNQMQGQINKIADDYQLTQDALSTLASGNGANYPDGQQAQYLFQIQQASSALNWVNNTYVNGQQPPSPPPGAAQRPGPPGPNGEGLVQLVNKWQPLQPEPFILNTISGYIDQQEAVLQQHFEPRTNQVRAENIAATAAAHESEVLTNEQAMASQVPDDIEATRAQLAAFYKTDITLAAPQNNTDSGGPARIAAPVEQASVPPVITGYTDSIRQMYPSQAAAAGLPLSFDLDPINPHTGVARIWHPDMPASISASLLAQYPGLAPSYNVQCTPDRIHRDWGWGQLWAAPIEQYFYDRVSSDAGRLDMDYFSVANVSTDPGVSQTIDYIRSVTLANLIRQLLGLPPKGSLQIKPLPAKLPGDVRVPPPPPPAQPGPPTYQPVAVPPTLTAPPASDAGYRTQLQLYTQHSGAFIGDVQGLRQMLQNYIYFYHVFTDPMAEAKWGDAVNNARLQVIQALGQNKAFLVLSTYQLREIPEWAQPGMFQSASISIEDWIVRLNMGQVTSALVRAGVPPGTAAQVADSVIRPIAHTAGLTIANEWVRRPWPYEITPPELPVLPYRGMSSDDRQKWFTVLAAARETADTQPFLLLTRIFGGETQKMATYAQAECFTWNEFNTSYGAAERYDTTVPSPWGGMYTGSPRFWRVGTTAGWDWRSRLSLSDALYPAIQNNEDFRNYLNDAGITNPDSGALDEINLH